MAKAKRKTRRQRSSADATKTTAITQGLQGGDPRDPKSRPKRIPMDQGMNLDVDKTLESEDYFYRWFAEHAGKGGRVDRAEKAGYEICTNETGEPITRSSGDGKLYLMRLPKQYHLEDMARKREKVKATLDQQTQLKSNEYAPTKNRPDGGDSSVVEHRETDNPYAM